MPPTRQAPSAHPPEEFRKLLSGDEKGDAQRAGAHSSICLDVDVCRDYPQCDEEHKDPEEVGGAFIQAALEEGIVYRIACYEQRKDKPCQGRNESALRYDCLHGHEDNPYRGYHEREDVRHFVVEYAWLLSSE